MEKRKPYFDPERGAKRVTIGPDGQDFVESIPLDDEEAMSLVLQSLGDLESHLRGARVEDYDTVFASIPEASLERYRHFANQLSMNLERIIKRKPKVT
ncbi:MAG: hypothetical protein WC817_00925 [Patescibacteria group bacterium]|jgi:hypothetical protein